MKISKEDKIFIAGHNGMVGSAILRLFKKEGFKNIITKSRKELDLTDARAVTEFFKTCKPGYVILAAAKVGGINANMKHQADFLYENLLIQNNVIYQAFKNNVKKLCFLGSSCIYPRESPQPIKEDYLLTGPLEPTNEGYAIAKIAGYKLCYFLSKQYGFNTISLMPCNLYGTNDNFNLENSHVLSALVRKFSDAADNGSGEVEVWGSGKPTREFLNVDDLAAAVLFMMENRDEPEIVNVGSGYDLSIKELAEKIAEHSGFKGKIAWNTSMPDGMMRKCMDVGRMRNLGYKPLISLDDGIKAMISEYRRLKAEGKA
jgi:GDP-L-fucose synthase